MRNPQTIEMEIQNATIKSERNLICSIGLYSSLVAFIAVAGYAIAQILQIAGIVKFPLDAYLIYGTSLCIAAPYVISVIALHHLAPEGKHVWSHIAIAFAIMYAVYVSLNYVVQLATVIPASLEGTLNEIKVLDQTPHSLFWNVDALGYVCFGVSTFALAFIFPSDQKWIRGFLLANGLATPLISFVYFYPHFSTSILLMGIPWIITAPGSLLMITFFFKSEKDSAPSANGMAGFH